jgi:hypothetical protein
MENDGIDSDIDVITTHHHNNSNMESLRDVFPDSHHNHRGKDCAQGELVKNYFDSYHQNSLQGYNELQKTNNNSSKSLPFDGCISFSSGPPTERVIRNTNTNECNVKNRDSILNSDIQTQGVGSFSRERTTRYTVPMFHERRSTDAPWQQEEVSHDNN